MSSNLFLNMSLNMSFALMKLMMFVLFSAFLLATGQAHAAAITASPSASSVLVEGWKCVHIPGAGTYCGEDGNNDDPKEK